MRCQTSAITLAASTAAAAVLVCTGSVLGQSQEVTGVVDSHVPPTVNYKSLDQQRILMKEAMMKLEIARIRDQQQGATRDSRRGSGNNNNSERGEPVFGDTCENAIPIPELPFVASGSTATASDNYAATCPFGDGGANDLVFSFTAGANDFFLSVNLCSLELTDYDTKLFVYQDSCLVGTEVACNDDSCTSAAFGGFSFVSRVDDVPLVPGSTYYVIIDGFGTNSGNFAATVSTSAEPPPPPSCPRAGENGAGPGIFNDPADESINATFTLSEQDLGFQQLARLDLSQALAVDGIRVFGGEMMYDAIGGPDPLNACEPSQDRTFDITIYDDFAGLPGNIICEYTEVVPVAIAGTGNFPFRDGANEIYSYDFVLPESCNTSGGWISVEGNTPNPPSLEDSVCAWLWSSSGVALGTGSLSLSFGTVSPLGTTLALCANGTTLSPGELTGACCAQIFVDIGIESGCVSGPGTACANEDGEFFPGLECGDVVCFQPRGACCMPGVETPGDRCLGLMTEDACAATEGAIWLADESCFQCPAPAPVNDNCADAIELEPNSVVVLNTAGATMEENEVNATCAGASAPTSGSVWYTFTSPAGMGGGSLIIETCGSPIDTVVALYDGCPGEDGARASEVACNDDGCGAASSVLIPWLPEGETVLVRVAGWNDTVGPVALTTTFSNQSACCTSSGCEMLSQDECLAFGPAALFKAGLTCDQSPNCNDDCSRSESVEGDFIEGVTVTGITDANAGMDGYQGTSPCTDIAAAGTGGFQGVWYTFTAPCDGLVDIVSFGDDTEIIVFGGDCPGDPSEVPIGCGGDDNGLEAVVTDMPVMADTDYFVRVAHWWQGGNLNANMTITLHDGVDCPTGECAGDGNGDLIVNVGDLLVVINNWGSGGSRGELEGDLNDDGVVNVADLLLVINNWGASCGG